MPDHGAAARFLVTLATALAIVGCSSMRGEPTGVATGEGRQQACRSACAAIGLDASPDSCEPCSCDQLAGKPAICTTTKRTRIP